VKVCPVQGRSGTRIMGMDPRIEMDLEVVHPPPKRPDAARPGRPMEAGLAEAHEREALNEEATERELAEKKVAAMPPDDGEAGSWQQEAEQA
jgi:hypothetical protein